MINKILSINDQHSQVNKTGNRNKDITLDGMQTDNSGEFDTRDVVEISNLKPVQPVTEDKNEINFSSDAKNAEKNIKGVEVAQGPKTEDSINPLPNSAASLYGQIESGIGTLLNKVV